MIYREVVLHGPTCESVIQLLARSPNTAIHVHNLELHAEESHRIEGPKLSLLVAQLARASMHNLRKFIWNVPTAQQRDDMWYSLRRQWVLFIILSQITDLTILVVLSSSPLAPALGCTSLVPVVQYVSYHIAQILF
jgi:hypothetical protein